MECGMRNSDCGMETGKKVAGCMLQVAGLKGETPPNRLQVERSWFLRPESLFSPRSLRALRKTKAFSLARCARDAEYAEGKARLGSGVTDGGRCALCGRECNMEFDIVLPTRNRQMALQLSIPLMLSQSRLPLHFIVVDSSDSHSEVRQLVESSPN
jgi:hypothetical protein